METPQSMELAEALAFLFNRIDYERKPAIPYQDRHLKLERMALLLDRLGNPHLSLPVVHVAGSKGKGSTATMIASVLTAAGFRTGLYTSPHLQNLQERIRVDGGMCGEAELEQLIVDARDVVVEMDRSEALRGHVENGPTFFEITTALAFMNFSRRQVDCAVMEVGLGGRLDSTNVCRSVVSVITNISYDHTKQLGSTLEAIAGEKAGIIKPAIPTVSGVTHNPARAVVEETAKRQRSRLSTLGDHFRLHYHSPENRHPAARDVSACFANFDYLQTDGEYRLDGIQLGMLGHHQATNAALAIATIAELRRQGWRVSNDAIRRGISHARCPARMEIIARQPTVIIDAAHNVASVEAFLAAIDEVFAGDRRTLVFATTRGKDVAGMLTHIIPRFDRIIFTQYRNNPRVHDATRLVATAHRILQSTNGKPPSMEVVKDSGEALDRALQGMSDGDLLAVCGSFFIAGELRPIMMKRFGGGEVRENHTSIR